MTAGEPGRVDAVVVGGGPNGLVAATLLADAGWSVVLLDAAARPGGAVASAPVCAPGYTTDLFSAFYPLAAVSPVLRDLRLADHGLRWSHAPTVLAHPLPGRPAAVLSRDPAVTAASLAVDDPSDGEAWLRVVADFERIREPLLAALLRPFPPVRPLATLARLLGAAGMSRLARFALQPVRRWGAETFAGAAAPTLVAGNALHTDLGPDDAGSALYGWLLAMLGQSVGFPVPVGGAGALADALTRRARAAGVVVRCGVEVEQVVVAGGRATGVRCAGGEQVSARRAVLAAVDAPQLLGRLLRDDAATAAARAGAVRDFAWDHATVKVDLALDAAVPWADPAVRGAGVVHVGGGLDALARYSHQLACGIVPDRPYAVVGLMTTADASRSPTGTESLWAYTHVPQRVRGDAGPDAVEGRWDAGETEAVARRVEAELERLAPGLGAHVVGRHVQGPRELAAADHSLHRGALGGGTSAAYQQLLWRPTVGTGRPETVVPGLYLASSSAHPGGGVHGAPGANAATVALRDHGVLGPVRRPVSRALTQWLGR